MMIRPEKATDLIVFSLLREKGYVDGKFDPINENVKVWANKSSNTKLNELLKSASKKASGNQGYPEYLILDEENNLVIVIENKNSTKKHSYKKLDEKVGDYAVNGALWYAKFIKDEYDVVAIGISGDRSENLLIDSYLWRKEAELFNNLGVKGILKISNYVDLINKSKLHRSSKETIIKLSETSKLINEFLRNILGVIEHERLYVLGAILYALEDPVFKMGYSQVNNNEELSLFIYQTVERKIKGSNVKEKQIIIDELKPVILSLNNSEKEGVKEKYPNGSLFHLVSTVDNSLLEFHKNREIDLMSTFFNVFLSYSTSGGSDLGIVLTPIHITKLFCDLADVSIDSKILDICVGTGGFLTSAWRRIALDPGFSHMEKENFRENNIIGVEKERSIYTIVALNMFINKDGRSNLYLGDSFSYKEELNKKECNIGFINPPYSDSVYSEIAFVELMLDSLLPNSIGVAIVPVNAVSSRTKKHSNINDVKKRILDKNELLASIQMPNNLFYPKGTETIILIFRTGAANSNPTWLAKFDDGYELIKHKKARTPSAISDKKHIEIVKAFKDRKETDFSFTKTLEFDDQWVYEIHNDFNYEVALSDIQETVNEYIGYLYMNNYL